MISLIVAAYLGQIQVINETGKNLGYVKAIECGTNMTCDVEHHMWVTMHAVGSNGDGGTIAVPGCGTNQFVTSDGGSLSCATQLFTVPGGSSPQVQYNNSGAFGGMAGVNSDGSRLVILGELNLATPASASGQTSHYDFQPLANFPAQEMLGGQYIGNLPQSVMTMFTDGQGGSGWVTSCVRMMGAGTLFATNTTAPTQTNWATAGGWTNGSLLTRLHMMQGSTTGVANNAASIIDGAPMAWLGNVAGAGGFIFWYRGGVFTAAAHARWMIGLQAGASAFGAADPSSVANTVYFGCDNGASPDANFHICSNTSSGTATCSDLGSSFPCRTSGAMYDFWLSAPPDGSSISYYANRLDSAGTATGTISSNLPQNTVQLRWITEVNAADGGAVATGAFSGECLSTNF